MVAPVWFKHCCSETGRARLSANTFAQAGEKPSAHVSIKASWFCGIAFELQWPTHKYVLWSAAGKLMVSSICFKFCPLATLYPAMTAIRSTITTGILREKGLISSRKAFISSNARCRP